MIRDIGPFDAFLVYSTALCDSKCVFDAKHLLTVTIASQHLDKRYLLLTNYSAQVTWYLLLL
jgi:hypothetical protein